MLSAYAAVGIRKPDFPKSIDQPRPKLSPEDVIEIVCNYCKIPFDKLTTPERVREKVYARQLCFYFLKNRTNLSLKSIGQLFGGRDHTSVIHSLSTLKDLYETDEKVKQDVINLNYMI